MNIVDDEMWSTPCDLFDVLPDLAGHPPGVPVHVGHHPAHLLSMGAGKAGVEHTGGFAGS